MYGFLKNDKSKSKSSSRDLSIHVGFFKEKKQQNHNLTTQVAWFSKILYSFIETYVLTNHNPTEGHFCHNGSQLMYSRYNYMNTS